MAKKKNRRVTRKELRIAFVLTVLDQLGDAMPSDIIASMKRASRGQKTMIRIGPSIHKILESPTEHNQVERVDRGSKTRYRITDQGKQFVATYSSAVQKYFPNIENIA